MISTSTGATGDREMGLGEKVVLTLAECIKGRHHQLYFDNYFTSINLLSKLLSEGAYGCGTIRTNRKQYPSEINVEAQRFQSGESIFRQSGNLVATAWKDNKVVQCSIYSCRSFRGHFRQQVTERWYMNIRLLSFVCGSVQPVHGWC